MVPVPIQPPLQERASVAVGSTSGQLSPITSHRSFGRRSVIRRRRTLVRCLLVRHRVFFHRHLVVARIGRKAKAFLAGVLIAFIGGQQVLERRIGFGVTLPSAKPGLSVTFWSALQASRKAAVLTLAGAATAGLASRLA